MSFFESVWIPISCPITNYFGRALLEYKVKYHSVMVSKMIKEFRKDEMYNITKQLKLGGDSLSAIQKKANKGDFITQLTKLSL
jgi:hypothetical protein